MFYSYRDYVYKDYLDYMHNENIRHEILNMILESKIVTNKSKDIDKIKGRFKNSFQKEERMSFFIL